MARHLSRSQLRRGTVFATAVAFAATAILLMWLALNSLMGPYAGTARRRALAAGSIIFATVGFAVAAGVVVGAMIRRRKLKGHLRPGEIIAGMFPCELVDLGDDDSALRARSIRLVLTNQRVLIHEPEQNPEPKMALELEEVMDVVDRGPTTCPGLRRCVLYELILSEGGVMTLRMDAGTSMDFRGPKQQYLEERKRDLRALVIEAYGPTPSRPAQALESILVDGEPTVGLFELNEHYLRVTNEHSPPLADLYYYFHWEHMMVGELEPADIDGLPDDWLRLRLQFHDSSSMVLCGSEAVLGRVRQRALSAGAAPARGNEPTPSPIGAP